MNLRFQIIRPLYTVVPWIFKPGSQHVPGFLKLLLSVCQYAHVLFVCVGMP